MDDKYKLSADNNVLRYEIEYPARGIIYDRKGKVMVYNQIAYDLMVTPKLVKNIDTADLCKMLNITKEAFIKKMKQIRMYSRFKASVFEKQISSQVYAGLQEKMYRYEGFYVQKRTLRMYSGDAASHTLGYVGEVSEKLTQKNPYYKSGDYIGISGIENSYEEELRGTKGVKVLMVDVFNRVKGRFRDGAYDTLTVKGKDIYSTLDMQLQEYGEKLMQHKTGSIVCIEPATGEILSIVSAPGYDPELLVGRVRSKNFVMLQQDSVNKPLFNRALMASYPPGSIFKLINGLIGQHEGVLTTSRTYPCSMGYPVMGGKPACHQHPSPLDLQRAVANSCNSYFCYVFRSVVDNKKYKNIEQSFEVWRKHVLSFGVGKRLHTDLNQELRGNVPSVNYYNKVFRKGGWKSSTIVSLSIGQGELGITPLQMANIMCIMANRGFYYTPHIVRGVGFEKFLDPKYKVKNKTTIDTSYYGVMVAGMRDAVLAGTAYNARINGIEVCGKTGTAQNPHGKDHSVFVCFAPMNNPKIAVACVVENGTFGNTWAAPIATLMIEKYLNDSTSRPDMEKQMMEGVVISTESLRK